MYGMARVGVSPYLHAASTILVALTAALVLAGDRLGRRRSASATTDAVS
jgi:ABC-type spermidine/putrescine transport system permease subunit II